MICIETGFVYIMLQGKYASVCICVQNPPPLTPIFLPFFFLLLLLLYLLGFYAKRMEKDGLDFESYPYPYYFKTHKKTRV
jgi:hypothetical protein